MTKYTCGTCTAYGSFDGVVRDYDICLIWNQVVCADDPVEKNTDREEDDFEVAFEMSPGKCWHRFQWQKWEVNEDGEHHPVDELPDVHEIPDGVPEDVYDGKPEEDREDN